jgi:L-arabonate dehydrase
LKPSDIMTKDAFENAIRVNGAIGGSTNAVVHLLAMAGRVGVDLTLADWDRLGRDVPTIVNLQPSGKYLMEEFFYAGGLPVVIKTLSEGGLLHDDAITVSGKSIGDEVSVAKNWNDDVIRPVDKALVKSGGIAVLRGNLAPNGAVLKPSAASAHLMQHKGRAYVFESIEDFHGTINDDSLDIDENSIMVLKYCGPKGYPGMAEVGNMGLPPKVLKKGIKDMIRISDARMSGTAYGTVILHVSPEAADGGPLALVKTGDMIEVDIPARRLHLDVSEAELAARRAVWVSPVEEAKSGYVRLYLDHVQQADKGADLDFLVGCRGSVVKRDSH